MASVRYKTKEKYIIKLKEYLKKIDELRNTRQKRDNVQR